MIWWSCLVEFAAAPNSTSLLFPSSSTIINQLFIHKSKKFDFEWSWIEWFCWLKRRREVCWIALPPGPAPPANKPIQSPIKSIFNLFDGIEWLFWRQAPPQEQQQIKKLYFLIWLDCSLGAASAAANHKSPISPFGRADWCDLLVLLMACGLSYRAPLSLSIIYLFVHS